MKIKFIPFINDADGQTWMNNVKKEFIDDNADITNEINQIRNQKPCILRFYDSKYMNSLPQDKPKILREKEKVCTDEVVNYYKNLRKLKEKRQKLWIEFLLDKVVDIYDKKIKSLSAPDKNANETTIVAALPEFFWHDINDNYKHTNPYDIFNYQKPLYENNILSTLCTNNSISKLTDKYKNLIFFAGTAKWKNIVNDDRSQEITNNTLFIYCSGKLPVIWGKHNFSSIDGFNHYVYNPVTGSYDDIKIKNPNGGSKTLTPPVINFNGIDFIYDICLDFISNINGNYGGPLSKQLCTGNLKNPVNVLIAGGMPIFKQIPQINNMNSDVILRCDANLDQRGTYVEIYDRVNNLNPRNIKNGNVFIGDIDIDIH